MAKLALSDRSRLLIENGHRRTVAAAQHDLDRVFADHGGDPAAGITPLVIEVLRRHGLTWDPGDAERYVAAIAAGERIEFVPGCLPH